jgi:hypothetical protein
MIQNAAALGVAMAENADQRAFLAIRYDVNGETHSDPAVMELVTDIYRRMNPWGRMYALHLGRWLTKVLRALATDVRSSAYARDHIPYLVDFFRPLNNPDSLLRNRSNLMRP